MAVILDIYNFYHFHQRLFENHILIKQKSPKIFWDKRKTTYCKVLFLFLFFFITETRHNLPELSDESNKPSRISTDPNR